MPNLAETVIEGSKDGYPELEEKKDFIFKVITKEEEQFNKTIDQGLVYSCRIWKQRWKATGETVLVRRRGVQVCMIRMDSRWI